MFSKQLEAAIANEVANQRTDLLKHIRMAILGEVNRIFDQALDHAPVSLHQTPAKPSTQAKLTAATIASRQGRALPKEAHAYIREQFDAGRSQREIARELDINLSTTQRSLKKTRGKKADKTRRVTSEKEKADVLRLNGEGKNNHEIANALGLNISTVWRVLHPDGELIGKVPGKRLKITDELRVRVIALLQTNKTILQMAKEAGVSDSTISRIKNAWVAEEMAKKEAALRERQQVEVTTLPPA